MFARSWVVSSVVVVVSPVCLGTMLSQISHDHTVYVDAQNGDVLSITTENRGSSDPAYVHVFGPNGRLQERLEITDWTTTYVTLNSGTGVYKILPVTNMYVFDYSIAGSRPMVVEPTDHVELIRVTGSANLYFQVPPNTPSITFHAHSMWSTGTITEELYDPDGSLVHTFVLPPHTFQEDYVVADPMPGSWRCRFVTSAYDRCGAWLEGVPNCFSSSPATWFEPGFYDSATSATLSADANAVVSGGARVGVNWWLNPWYPDPQAYEAERDAVTEALMDTARLGVLWAWREPANDNSDPFDIDWQGFNFSGHDAIVALYYNDVISVVPAAMPVLMFHWDNIGDNAVSWQLENPATWTQTQREEYAEFVLATIIHTVAPDLQDPPDPGPAYDFTYVELLNEPNLVMGSSSYQAYIDIVITVGQRLQAHPDPRINSLKIAAPGVSPGWGDADQVMENWIGKLIDQADAYVDGVNWHQYDYLHIEECHRFAEDIQNMLGWLATRGDAVADEEILMTEMNQHGGGPTWWQRQDTFYASRWWAGACLSALRGGVDFLHFYKLVDDPPGSYNWKGMLFNEGPYDPPVFPGGPPHGRKLIYQAAKFINVHRRDQIVLSTGDHAEVAHAVTLSQDHSGVTVLVANLFDRVIDLDLSVTLPPDMQNESFSMQLYQLDEDGGASRPIQLPSPPPSSDLSASLVLSPQTVYAVDFQCSASIPTVSVWGMMTMMLLALITGSILIGRACLPRRRVCAALLCCLAFAASGTAEGTPPIHVLIDVHADPMGGPPLVQQQTYQDWIDATNWLMDVVEPRGAKISFLSTGEFMEWVLEDPDQGNPLMQRLYASGGQLGTHSHNKIRISTHNWQALGPSPTPEQLLQLWNDHVGAVNAVITAALGISDPAGLHAVNCNRGAQIPGDPADRLPMMADFGFTIHEQGPDQEFYAYFTHYVMNPYRPSESGFLIEDPSGPVVLPPTGSILGINDFHFGILQDNRMRAKQGRFLLELLNWLHDVHVAGTDRVWTFGWGSHCHDYLPGTVTRLELIPMLDWLLDHFVGQPVGGQVAAAFASFPEARDAYIAWEAGHPNESSFSYLAGETDWDLYPYLIPAVRYLTEAWYENPMPPIATVRWHSLAASEAAGGPYTLYVAFTADGVPTTVDLSGPLGVGEVAAVDPVTGSAHALSTSAVEVDTIGTILVPLDKIMVFPGTGDFDGNGHVEVYDYDQFELCFTGPGGGPIDTACEPGDFDGDGDIDCFDWDQFGQAWTEPENPPDLLQCGGPIPAVSEWGMLAMTLLVLTAGILMTAGRKKVSGKAPG